MITCERSLLVIPHAWLGSGIITTEHWKYSRGHMCQTGITVGRADEIAPSVYLKSISFLEEVVDMY